MSTLERDIQREPSLSRLVGFPPTRRLTLRAWLSGRRITLGSGLTIPCGSRGGQRLPPVPQPQGLATLLPSGQGIRTRYRGRQPSTQRSTGNSGDRWRETWLRGNWITVRHTLAELLLKEGKRSGALLSAKADSRRVTNFLCDDGSVGVLFPRPEDHALGGRARDGARVASRRGAAATAGGRGRDPGCLAPADKR